MKRQIEAAAVAFVLMSAFCASSQETYSQTKNVVYGEAHGIGLVMDVFSPAGKSNGLGVIDVVSGGWSSSRGKIRDHKLAQVYNIFCSRGYTVFAIRPGSISKFTGHEMLEHLLQGIAWVKENASDYSIDPKRLGMTGASAGGHLAALAATRATDASHTVACVGIFFPPTDLLVLSGADKQQDTKSEASLLLRAIAMDGRNPKKNSLNLKEALRELSPALLVSGNEPPFLVIHGDADPVVPLDQSQRLVSALTAKEVPAELIIKKGGGHPWLTIPKEVGVIADWMDGRLKADK